MFALLVLAQSDSICQLRFLQSVTLGLQQAVSLHASTSPNNPVIDYLGGCFVQKRGYQMRYCTNYLTPLQQ